MDLLKEGMSLSAIEKNSVFIPYKNWLTSNKYRFSLYADIIPHKVAPNDLKHTKKREEVRREVRRLARF